MATILLIEDSEVQRGEIRAALERAGGFDRVLEAGDGLCGLRMLLEEPVDVVLCDLEMPGLDGEKLLRVRNANPAGAAVPFLFVTASGDRDRRARLLEDGACDAVTKPFHPPDLVARLKLHLKIKELQDELLVKNKRLEYLSTTDELTGLRTRRFINEVMATEFMRAERYATDLSVLMADLDHFKAINDEFGHPAGDAVLRGVCERLLGDLRATDVAGRYGGEEFIVVLPHNCLEGARIAADRWRESVAKTSFRIPGGRRIRASLSVGVAAYHAGLREPAELISAADTALYQAKENGRDRVEVFEP